MIEIPPGYPDDCILTPCMIQAYVLPEQRPEFGKRWYRAIDRYKAKYGTWPGWKSRAHILGGLNHSVKCGLFGNSAWGLNKGKQSNARKKYNKYQKLGMTIREIVLTGLAGTGRKQAAYKERVAEAESRRAKRARPDR